MTLFKKNEYSWFKYYKDIPKTIDYGDLTLYESILKISNNHPNSVAYTYYQKNVTYKELIKMINKCSLSLLKLGVKPKTVVSICMPNTPEAIIIFYAINSLGAIANMIHPLSSEKDIKHALNISNSEFIFIVDFAYPNLINIIKHTKIKKAIVLSISVSLDKISSFIYYLSKGRKIKRINYNDKVISYKRFLRLHKQIPNYTHSHYSSSSPAVILYSGGTTGNPKGILLSNYNITSIAISERAINKDLILDSSILSIMPIFHGFGLASCIHAALSIGARCIILPNVNQKKIGTIVLKYKPNIIATVPSMFESLINDDKLSNKDLSYITCALCGGDTLGPSLKSQIDSFLNAHNSKSNIRTAYGMTECVSGVCMTPKGINRDNSVGIPIPDCIIKICKPNTHTELPYNQIGEICISSPSLMIGYLKEPKETAKMLQKHKDGIFLHSGDLGYMDPDGFVYFKQRLKRMIISNGYNLYPSYIENILNSHPLVLTSSVISIPHPYKVEVAKAYIVLKPSYKGNEAIKRSIYNHCSKNLPKYSIPYEIEFIDSLPKTLIGKVAYKKLKK